MCDIVSQVRSTQTSAPAMPYTLVSAPANSRPVLPETVVVTRTYDREGNVLTIRTFPSGDSVDVNAVESFTYDNAGRVLTRNRSSGPLSFTYDEAGNPRVQVYRGGFNVTERYDALNRRIERIVPERLHNTEGCSAFPAGPISGPGASCLMTFPFYPNDPAGLRIPADTNTFAYDAVGNLTRADNADARVRRAYTLNGQVAIDTLAIRSYATPSFTTTVFVTRYGYDRNGRRKWMRVPSQIAVGDSIDYRYNANGLLVEVRDPGARRHLLGYDNGRRPHSYDVTPPGTPPRMTEGYQYDDDDRLIRRTRNLLGGVGGLVSADTLRYDARGKLLTVRRRTRVQSVGMEHVDLAYSGLGAVVAQDRRYNAGTQWQIEEYRSDPLGHLYWQQTKSSVNGPQLEQHSLFTLRPARLPRARRRSRRIPRRTRSGRTR